MDVFTARVLILAPVGRDAQIAHDLLLRRGIDAHICRSAADLIAQIGLSAGAVLVTEEALAFTNLGQLAAALEQQPSWSDVPFVMLTRRGRNAASRSEQLAHVLPRRLTHIVYLERPVSSLSLFSALDAALSARRRQFQIRDELHAVSLAAASLRQSEARLQFAMSAGGLGAWEFDLQTREIVASASTRRILGCDSFSRLSVALLAPRLHPDDVAAVDAAFRVALRDQGDVDFECRMRVDAAQWRWIGVRGTVSTHPASGAVDGMTGVLHDVTVRKEAEAALALSRDQLEALVAIRTRELGESHQQLLREANERRRAEEALVQAQKMEAVGRLTGGIAHDFNNLLMALVGNLELAGRHLAPDDPAQRFIQNAKRATERGTRLSSQLLAFSRIQKLTLQSVELDQVLTDLLDLARHSLGASHSLRTDFAAGMAHATTDPNQLELAVLNLVTNARDAMPDGGEVVVATRVVTVDDGDQELDAGRYVEVAVTDSGSGMSADVLARVFEPFFTTKPIGKGTGLGLAQVYGITRQCGGAVRVRTAPGAGTTFSLLFPFVAENARGASALPEGALPAPALQTAGRTVLIIDDDDNVRESFAAGLTLEGYVVEEARSGSEGLAKLALHAPDVLIVDYAMPGMNGADVAQEAQRLYPRLPVIMVSGYSDSAALDRVANAEIIRKPFSLSRLSVVLATTLNQAAEPGD
ncbi:MAG: ATP-binding protein [Janthinobacterium lividum]